MSKLVSTLFLSVGLGMCLAQAQGTKLQPINAVKGTSVSGGMSLELTSAKGTSMTIAIDSLSVDFQQVLNIGSQSSGAGAGKVTFNPFTITRKFDSNSPTLFSMMCAGTTFKSAVVHVGNASITFGLVAVRTMGLTSDGASLAETVSFEYGGVNLSDGATSKGWNRVKNIGWDTTAVAVN